MEYEEARPTPRKRRRSPWLVVGLCAVLLVVVVAVGLGVGLRPRGGTAADAFRSTVVARCEKFKEKSKRHRENDCQKIWSVFERAYVGKDPCRVPMEAYDPLTLTVTQDPACNRMLFWSKTKDMVHDFTEKRDCYLTLEDSLLGYVLDGLTWCGREGSNETFTTGCPGWTECADNPVRSFWNRASAAFADDACGKVTAMLNGSIAIPFSPTSIFATIEVKRFNATKMSGLDVVLVTKENDMTACDNPSLVDLRKELDPKLKFSCKPVSESQIQACMSNPDTPCGACW